VRRHGAGARAQKEGLMATDVVKAIDNFREWELAGGRFKGPQTVLPLAKFDERSDHRYNLKHFTQRKFLQWEKQTFGINLGYTDNATPETARKVARWFFTRKTGGEGPILYGEDVAIGYGTVPSFYRYQKRAWGVNIANVEAPAFEWKLIGPHGSGGQPVKTGEWLAIYNGVEEDFLIYFGRDVGVDLGWPDSQSWGTQLKGWAKNALKEATKDYLKSYLGK
jgi:hypothetical protein